jgi:hypothetical protein
MINQEISVEYTMSTQISCFVTLHLLFCCWDYKYHLAG